MIFQANQEDEVFFDIGKGFQSIIPEKRMVNHNQPAPKGFGSNNSADEVHFNVESEKITKPIKDVFQKEYSFNNSRGSNHQSGQVVAPIPAVYFPQPALEPMEVLASGKEEEVNYNSVIEKAGQTVRQETREVAMDSPRKDRSALGIVRKMDNTNQSIVSPKESVDGKAGSSSPLHETDAVYPTNIFDQIKERFNVFQNTLNETKTSQSSLKSPEIIGFSTLGISESKQDAIAKNSSEQGKGSSSDQSSPQVDLPVFKALAGETVTATGYRIVSLFGYAEQENQMHLQQFLDKVIYQGSNNILFDLSKLVSMSSSGWGVLAAFLQRLKKQDGAICLCAMTGEVLQCFRVLELDKIFPYYPSVFEALRAIKQSHDAGSQEKLNQGSTALPHTKLDHIAHLPLEEKIRRIIAENPNLSVREISKKLKTEDYGIVSINLWSLQAKLRSMNLGTKEERYRFFRSS